MTSRHSLKIACLVCSTLISGWAAAEQLSPYTPQTVWNTTQDTLSISSFAYMDRNESGAYDQGDQPLSGIFFVLERDGQELWRVKSNENGFANFPGSRVTSDAALHELGEYDFRALVPPGWRVSSDNTTQTQRFVDVPGAPMGGGLTEVMKPVGLIPLKQIRGQATPGTELTLSGPGVTSQPIEVTNSGRFEVPVPGRGLYELTSGNITRRVEIAEYPVDIGTFRNMEAMSERQKNLSFDDISQNWLRKVPSGYGGLEWFNLNAVKNTFYKGSVGYVNGATSGSFVAYTSSGHPARISHPDGFDFLEMNISVSWPAAEGETAIFEFWRGAEKVAEDRVVLSTYAPVRYAPHMIGITSVRISTLHYWQLVIDDLVIGLGP